MQLDTRALLENEMNCLRCKGEMEAGFVPDSHLGPEFWVPGPRPSFFKRLVGYKVKIPITTYRCTACGYLEAVAEG